jgi:hypothetical protein
MKPANLQKWKANHRYTLLRTHTRPRQTPTRFTLRHSIFQYGLPVMDIQNQSIDEKWRRIEFLLNAKKESLHSGEQSEMLDTLGR